MTPEQGLLSVEAANANHDAALQAYGGAPGVRDAGLLESAVHAAANVLHYGEGDIFEVAAAYAYHIAENQPFLDGNKRTGISSALMYLMSQGYEVLNREDELYQAMFSIANKTLDREGFARCLRSWATTIP